MSEPPSSERPPDEVEFYAHRSEAEERALVAAAMGVAYRIEHLDDGTYSLQVAERNRAAVLGELEKFEKESTARKKIPLPGVLEKIPATSLFVCGWMMAVFFLIQKFGPPWWEDAGISSSEAIAQSGEWWRTVTALTLHADLSHLAANLASGLLFAMFLLPLLGTGWTWALIVASGTAGNLLNALGYRHEPHFSLGASTAVFGALGILTACQTLDAMRLTRAVRLWEIILPFGAGLSLLAYLGTGDEHTDLLAHFWGFVAGLILGVPANLLRLKIRTPVLMQQFLAAGALFALVAAWIAARYF